MGDKEIRENFEIAFDLTRDGNWRRQGSKFRVDCVYRLINKSPVHYKDSVYHLVLEDRPYGSQQIYLASRLGN